MPAACSEEGRFGETEQLLTRIGLGEYLAQIFGAIPMNQGEIVRLADFGLAPQEVAPFRNEAVESLIAEATPAKTAPPLQLLIGEAPEGAIGDPGLDDTSRRSAARCAASPTPRSCPTRKGGIAPTPTSRSRSSRA